MKIMFLGPPGAGKGTQAKILEKKYDAFQVSTGDILRKSIEQKTDLGLKAKEYMEQGKLVPDDLMIALIKEKFADPNFSKNWIMDGFPRTVPQAESFDALLNELGMKLDCVIEVDVNRTVLVKRLTGRRVCKDCQAPFHVDFNPPKVDGVCDYCQSTNIYQRSDDKEDVVLNRLKVYDDQTAPLIKYYTDKNLLHKMDGDLPVEEVTKKIESLL
ncbi:MAG: adenylate kinase [Candidatus Sericytochromatia bacterium]